MEVRSSESGSVGAKGAGCPLVERGGDPQDTGPLGSEAVGRLFAAIIAETRAAQGRVA